MVARNEINIQDQQNTLMDSHQKAETALRPLQRKNSYQLVRKLVEFEMENNKKPRGIMKKRRSVMVTDDMLKL